MRLWGNEYNKMEFAGAFGDLGTLIPFVVGYITLNKMDPLGILVAFGLFKIFVGLYFRTPVPIQPMKAIGGMALAHPGTITHGMIWGSGIFTGLFWLFMGLTGAITWVEKITTKPVVRGIMLGLGLSFVVEALEMMRGEPLFAIGGIVITLLLLNSKRFPAMLILLGYGIAIAFLQKPYLWGELSHISVRFRFPELTFARMSWQELLAGFVILGLPQASMPFTLLKVTWHQLIPEREMKPKLTGLPAEDQTGCHDLAGVVDSPIFRIPYPLPNSSIAFFATRSPSCLARSRWASSPSLITMAP